MIKQIEKLRKQDPESTSYPYWVIVDPTQNMGKDIHAAAAQITGVFFSRKDAEDFLVQTRYNFSPRAAVYCLSGCYSEEWCDLYDKNEQEEVPKSAIHSEFFRIKGVALGSDNAIEMFKDTPISSILKQRRNIARNILAKKSINHDDVAVMDSYDQSLKKYLEIK